MLNAVTEKLRRYILEMLYCSWCDNSFFDGETIIIRLCNHQEIPMHAECFSAWCDNERELLKIFGTDTLSDAVQWFERPFRLSQIEPKVNQVNNLALPK